MVIAKLSNGTLILGLTRENIERLTAGRPIRITEQSHGVQMSGDVQSIGIMYGETTQAIMDQLESGAQCH